MIGETRGTRPDNAKLFVTDGAAHPPLGVRKRALLLVARCAGNSGIPARRPYLIALLCDAAARLTLPTAPYAVLFRAGMAAGATRAANS